MRGLSSITPGSIRSEAGHQFEWTAAENWQSQQKPLVWVRPGLTRSAGWTVYDGNGGNHGFFGENAEERAFDFAVQLLKSASS